MARKSAIQRILHHPRLPSLPVVAIKVLELTRDENVNFREVADVIQNDQALAIKIIRTVNSSYFGLIRPCTSINQAIVFLGIEAVKTLVLGFSLVDCIDGSSEYDVGFDYTAYWRRSLHAAVAAREVARLSKLCDPEEAFLAALVQDVGMVALYRAFRDVYVQIVDLTNGDHSKLVQIERRSIKMDHADVGAELGSMWNLPPQLVASIRYHHDSNASPESLVTLVRIVELAGHVAEAIRMHEASRPPAADQLQRPQRLSELMRDLAGLNASAAEHILCTVGCAARDLAELFKVELRTPMEIDQTLDEAEDRRVRREVIGHHHASGMPRSIVHGPSQVNHGELAALTNTGTGTIAPMIAGHIVGSADFRRQLRTAIAEAQHTNGCVGLMVCSLSISREHCDDATKQSMAERISEEFGSECLVTVDESNRAMICVPHADHVIMARLAQTMYSRLGTSEVMLSQDVAHESEWRLVNIGAAAYENASRAMITDERTLVSLAEQALAIAEAVEPGAIRIFDPVTSSEGDA